jgi:hypothetical protein
VSLQSIVHGGEKESGYFWTLRGGSVMVKFFLWLILLVLCWPLALLALILYPIVWLLTLPFRLLGITVSAVFDLLKAIITLPARILRGGKR